jgi:hypothetical protein
MPGMKNPRWMFAMTAFVVVFMFAISAFAQGPTPGPVSVLTPVTGTVLVLNFVIGFFGNSLATGKILGQWNLNPSLIPIFTLGGSFLMGALGVLTQATAFTGTVIFNMVIMGGFSVLTATGGMKAHSHMQDAGNLKKAKMAAKAAAKVAALVLVLGLLGGTQTACKGGSVLPGIEAVVQVVENDLKNNVSESQMASDVCQALGGSAPTDAICSVVPVLIQDAIQLLIDGGTLPPNALSNAQKYMAAHPKAAAPASPAGASK